MTETAQRQPLVLLFTDISGSTRLSGIMEPEEYADILGQLRQLLTTVMARHGGEVVRIDGDGALCLFGYPIAYEDAARRAVEAALDLHAGAALLDVMAAGVSEPLRLHSGIHGGLVLLRHGDVVRGRYEVLGDATNVAARLCDAAKAGQILVSDVALGSDRDFFQCDDGVRVTVAGHAQPVSATVIGGRSVVDRRYAARRARRRLALVGRDAERAHFAGWLDRPGTRTDVLLIHARPGFGKSRLLEQLALDAQSKGWRVEQGWCESYLSAQVLQPFRQIAEKLGHAGGEPALTPDRMAALLHSAGPIVLMIDDWQWSDDASRNLLQALLDGHAGVAGAPVKLLLASREEGDVAPSDSGEADIIALPPLDAAETAMAVTALVPHADDFTIASIHEASGGIPLLIEELCHALLLDGATPATDARNLWFDMAIQTRSERLDAASRALLRKAAVVGHHVPVWLVAAMSNDAVRQEVLERLAEQDFLEVAGSGDYLHFKHGLTRDAIYAGIGREERLTAHRQALAALEQAAEREQRRPLLDALAHHSVAAGETARAIIYTIEATDAALGDGALDRAQAHIQAVLPLVVACKDATVATPAMFRLLGRYGRAAIFDPSSEALATFATFRAYFEQAGEASGLRRAAYWQGSMAYGIGEGVTAVALLETANALCEEAQDEALAVHVRMRLASALGTAGRFAEAIAMMEQLSRNYPPLESMDDGQIYAGLSLAFLLADHGDMARSRSMFDQLGTRLTSGEEMTRLSHHSYAATAAVLAGEWDRALALVAAYRPLGLRARARFQLVFCDALRAYARWRAFGDADSIEQLERCAAWYRTPGNGAQRVSLVFGWLADVHADTGDRTRARAHAAYLIARKRRTGDCFGETMMWRALAKLEGKAGRAARRDHYLAKADLSARQRGSHREAAENDRLRAMLALPATR